jgi:hypothetical protein
VLIMATRMLWHVTLPETDADEEGDPAHFAPFQIALDGMCKLNEWHIRRALKRTAKGTGVPVPPLYASGVVYAEDPPGEENWRDVYSVLARGRGDCDNLVGWRVGELRANDVKAEPVLKWQFVPTATMIEIQPTKELKDKWRRELAGQKGLWMVHCLVRMPDGAIEDPSKILGMGGSFNNGI